MYFIHTWNGNQWILQAQRDKLTNAKQIALFLADGKATIITDNDGNIVFQIHQEMRG